MICNYDVCSVTHIAESQLDHNTLAIYKRSDEEQCCQIGVFYSNLSKSKSELCKHTNPTNNKLYKLSNNNNNIVAHHIKQ